MNTEKIFPNGIELWNPQHGCHKISAGCQNCYVYTMDKMFGRDPSVITKTNSFDKPVWTDRYGNWYYPEGTFFLVCFSSDFFIEEADQWRDELWSMMRDRPDCVFFIITKRIHRFEECIPNYWWDELVDHVIICSTVENQDRAHYRIPRLLAYPIKHRALCCEPLLEEVDLSSYLATGLIHHVIIGGESGRGAREVRYEWIKKIVDDCNKYGITYSAKQLGSNYVDENGQYHRLNKEARTTMPYNGMFENNISIEEFHKIFY